MIDEYLDALAPDLAVMDFRTFADMIDVFFYDPLIAEPWTRLHTIPMIEAIERKKISLHEVGWLLHNPTATRCLLHYDLFMAKCARFGVPIYLRIFKFYSDILHAVCLTDRFVKNKRNIIHTSQQVSEMVARCTAATPEIARALGKLSNACYQLSYGLYSDMNPQLVYDNFGPYIQTDGTMFALKIFHNLKPVELWEETSALPVRDIDVGALFEGVTLAVDCASHGIYQGDQINGLRGSWCSADGRRIDIPEVGSIREDIEKMAIKIYTKVKAMSMEEKKELYWNQKAWGYKKLYERLGFDWRPAQEVIEAGRNKTPWFSRWQIPEEKSKVAGALRAIWDPRYEIPEHILK